jgi:nucleoid-associated protein
VSLTFFEASKQLLTVLVTKADPVAFATGGYVLMAHLISEQDVSWFIVAIINNVDSSAIDDEKLEVRKSVHVDLENVRVAGRVNITDWLGGDLEKRYVSFLKQRGDVADYFKLFLGCNELIDDVEESKKLVTVLKAFAKAEGLEQKEKEDFLQQAHDFCNTDQPLSLEALANAIWPNDPNKLQHAFVEGDVQIRDGFKPDGRSIKSLTRMKYKTNYWSVDLDRHALSSGYARYNQKKGELILLNLPDELKAELDTEMDKNIEDE